MKYKFYLFFLFFLFVFFLFVFYKISLCEEIPTITVQPTSFSKILIRVPDFEGDKKLSTKLTPLLRRLLNYHLFILALENPPLPNFPSKEYYLKGQIEKRGNEIFIKAELIDTLENKVLKIYKVTGSSSYPQSLIYALCDKLVESISHYKGIAFTKIVFVKRTSKGDKLYVADFSKENPRLLRKAPLVLFPKFSKKGDKIAYLVYENHKYYLEIYDFRNSTKRKFFIEGICSSPVWLPDGEELIITAEKGQSMALYRFNLKTQKLDLLIKTEEGILQAGSVSSGGIFLTYVYGKRAGTPQIYLLDLETLKSYKIPQKGVYNTSPRFSPKGEGLLFLSKSSSISSIILYNLRTKEQREIKFLGNLEDPAFSPTGDYILAFGEGRKGKGVYLIHLDSSLTYLYLPGKNFVSVDWAEL
ncbi:MAG: Periplasmic component TolB of the Tol biopolymer transport system [Thermodesulfobacterium sp.]|uniref:Periplasmic component TolB of the Tol biopolymer transport system n=1 Tax=Candidatus Thermodesulfobacterium syntrophicum TaxID=3060442 RepID=A0AAE3P613_9BACT|nr:Periplasmic component TolB of the Tol biopolymer transport system [Candidatus Thermodesulfobacterium syntrophicum]